MVILIFW